MCIVFYYRGRIPAVAAVPRTIEPPRGVSPRYKRAYVYP